MAAEPGWGGSHRMELGNEALSPVACGWRSPVSLNTGYTVAIVGHSVSH